MLLPSSEASGWSCSPSLQLAQDRKKLSFPSIDFPAQLPAPIAMETREDAKQGKAAWLGGSRSGKGSRRRRLGVARLGASAGVSPGPSPCKKVEDERWLGLPIPLTPQGG